MLVMQLTCKIWYFMNLCASVCRWCGGGLADMEEDSVVRLRGLPWSTKPEEIIKFLEGVLSATFAPFFISESR